MTDSTPHAPGCRAHLTTAGAQWPITVNATVRTAFGTITLHRDNKTAPGTRKDSQGRWSAIPNAIMLPAGPSSLGGTCGELEQSDGLTGHCAGCYAANLERAYPALRTATERNLDTLRAAHAAAGVDAVVDVLVACIEHSARAQRAAGVLRPLFRHQSDGDLIDGWHADALRIAALRTPDVAHWLYTRKARAAARIVAAGRPQNLAILLSADRENVRAMLSAAAVLELPIAYLSDGTEGDARNVARIAELSGRRPFSCPATGAWTSDGRGPAHIVGASGRRADMGPDARVGAGACAACAKCVHAGGPSIIFDRHGGAPKRSAREVFVSLRSARGVNA